MTGRSGCPAKQHGAYWHYDSLGCRCPDAREASRLRRKRIRQHRYQPLYVDSTGTRRRLQALAAMGWTAADIANRMGVTTRTIEAIHAGATRVRRTVHNAGVTVYDDLAMTPGPSSRAAARARNRGWHTALAWDDDTIDDPTAKPTVGRVASAVAPDPAAVLRGLTGEPSALTRRIDRRAAIFHLVARDVPAEHIAFRLGMSVAAVEKTTTRYHLTRPRQGVAA